MKRLLTVLLLAFVACHRNDDDGKGPAAQAAEQDIDCEDFAARVCAEYSRCAPYALNLAIGSAERCEHHLRSACEQAVDAGRPPAFSKCQTLVEQEDCSGFHGARIPIECWFGPGPGKSGAPCTSDQNCGSLYCDIKDSCGFCAERSELGELCGVGTPCTSGLVCAEGTCEVLRAAGESCKFDSQCGRACVDKQCRSAGLDGEACSSIGDCSAVHGLECGLDTRTCSAVAGACEADCNEQALLGEACDEDGTCASPGLCVEGSCVLISPEDGC